MAWKQMTSFRMVKPIKSEQTMGGDNPCTRKSRRTKWPISDMHASRIRCGWDKKRQRTSRLAVSNFQGNIKAFAIIQRPEASQEIQRQSPKNKQRCPRFQQRSRVSRLNVSNSRQKRYDLAGMRGTFYDANILKLMKCTQSMRQNIVIFICFLLHDGQLSSFFRIFASQILAISV